MLNSSSKISRTSTNLLVVLGVAVVGLIVGAFLIWQLMLPVDSSLGQSGRFVIPRGQALGIIANRLAEEGYIRNPLVFRFVVWKLGIQNEIQAGSFEIDSGMNVWEIADELTKGTDDVWITIVEGWRAEEIADMLDRQGFEDFNKEEFLALAEGNEGTLFPDSYLLPRLATAQTIYSLMTNTFEKKVEMGLADEISTANYPFDEILIMASIVEREARGYEQARVVAGILWNRIQIGMPLQVDATLQYVKGYNSAQQTWWPEPTAADKELVSPFNTYLNPGLPPAPISNPGLDVIKATLNPLPSDDYFYLHDLQGRIHTAETLDGHNANVNRYLR